jgi:hypothetical protein
MGAVLFSNSLILVFVVVLVVKFDIALVASSLLTSTTLSALMSRWKI